MHALSRIVWQPGFTPAQPLWRELWQAPVFLTGLLALGVVAGLYFGLPPAADAPLAKELIAAQAELEAGDAAAALERATAALQHIATAPHLAGEFHLVRGSALLLQADQAGVSERVDLYPQARDELREAERLGVNKEREPRLQYRLALAEYRTGGDVDEVAQRIDQVLDASPVDRLRGYALLTQLHLNRSPPNLDAALKANERLLAQPNLENPNPARLERGQLLLRKQEREAARQVLVRIPITAPEYPEARHLRAWSHHEDGEWQAAIELWEPAFKAEDAKLPHLPQALFALGKCYLQVGRPAPDVQAIWQRIQREAPDSEEARAAALGLAILHLHAGQEDDALAQFTLALRGLSPTWQSAYADAAEVRGLIEKSFDAWLSASSFESARRLAQLSTSVALPGEAARRFAQASQEAGVALLKKAEGTNSTEREQLVSEGRKLLLEAAESYERAVRELALEGDSVHLLWLSAENYLQAREPARAATVLETYLRGDLTPERRQQAQVALGEAYQALRRSEDAAGLLRQAAAQAGPLQLRARYLLALAQLDLAKYDEAESTLKGILRMPVLDRMTPEPRLARAALVHLLFKKEAYADAADYLEKELQQEPQHPQALQTRYWLAEAYRRAARREQKNISAADTSAARDFYLKLKKQQIEKALAQFQLVATGLEKEAPAADEQARLRESRLGVGECLSNLGRYDEAIVVYAALMRDEGSSALGLTAAMHLTHCYLTLKKLDEARTTVAAARVALEKLSDQELESTGSKRSAWQDWFNNAAASTQVKN